MKLLVEEAAPLDELCGQLVMGARACARSGVVKQPGEDLVVAEGEGGRDRVKERDRKRVRARSSSRTSCRGCWW